MQSHLHTRLYCLDTRNIDHEAAHLYEHLLIWSFSGLLKDRSIPTFLSGWVSGQTFEEIMFIEAGLYLESAAKLFDNYMKTADRIDWSLLDRGIDSIQAEYKAEATSINYDLLQRELQLLDSSRFSSFDTINPAYHPAKPREQKNTNVIILRPAKRKFRDLTIQFGADSLSETEKLAFLRTAPLIRHYIDSVLLLLGAHQSEWSHIVDRPNNGLMGFDIYTIKKGVTTTHALQEQLTEHLHELLEEVTTHSHALRKYATAFQYESRWEDFPIQSFRWSGIAAPRTHIARALTRENVVLLLEKLQFKVGPTIAEHWNYT